MSTTVNPQGLRLAGGMAVVVSASLALGACSSSGSGSTGSTGSTSSAGSTSSTSSTGSTAKAAGKTLKIGMMVPGPAPYYSVVAAGAKAEAKKMGVDLAITNAQGSLTQENAQIQQFISQKKDAIIVIASESNGDAPSIRQANAANIPVIASQTEINGAKTVAYVGANNVEYGKYLADATAKATGGKGNVAIILGALGNSAMLGRLKGFQDQAAAKYPGMKVVAKQTANWDNNQALKVSQDFLSKYPKGQLAAIVDEGPEGVTGAAYAKKNGRSDVKFILGDIPTAVSDAIKSGVVQSAVYQNPTLQGQMALQDAVKSAQGKSSEVKNPDLAPILIVTSANLGKVNPYNY